MVLFAKVVISTLALLPFFVFIEKRLGQHWFCCLTFNFSVKIYRSIAQITPAIKLKIKILR